MTEVQEVMTQTAAPSQEEKNFASLRKAFEAEKREKELLAQRLAQIEADRKRTMHVEEDDSDEPYVDQRRLNKTLSSFESKLEEKIEKKAEEKARRMIEQERQQSWLRSNPDFYQVMEHAQKLAEADPELAETILTMPDNFDRNKLVYKNIKAMGLHKPAVPKETIQDKVNNNKKSVFYKPTDGVVPPYSIEADYSQNSQKAAYEKMMALKKNMRLG